MEKNKMKFKKKKYKAQRVLQMIFVDIAWSQMVKFCGMAVHNIMFK